MSNNRSICIEMRGRMSMSRAGGPSSDSKSKQTLSVLLRSDDTNTAVCRRLSGMPCCSRALEAANKFEVLSTLFSLQESELSVFNLLMLCQKACHDALQPLTPCSWVDAISGCISSVQTACFVWATEGTAATYFQSCCFAQRFAFALIYSQSCLQA